MNRPAVVLAAVVAACRDAGVYDGAAVRAVARAVREQTADLTDGDLSAAAQTASRVAAKRIRAHRRAAGPERSHDRPRGQDGHRP